MYKQMVLRLLPTPDLNFHCQAILSKGLKINIKKYLELRLWLHDDYIFYLVCSSKYATT